MSQRKNYWQHKISLFLHDPVDKPLSVPGHEERAAKIVELLKQTVADKDQYNLSDWIASGLTRAALPGYSSDRQNGAVDFLKDPCITHPLVEKSLQFKVDHAVSVAQLNNQLADLLRKDLGIDIDAEKFAAISDEELPFNGLYHYSQDHEKWSQALYFYLFFALRKRLRAENIGGLGALWELLPADTRMPDHSLWHHCALTSALGSATADSESGSVSLVVFSVTPVQQFIAKARKLRDLWSGSVLLSDLAFSGITAVMEELGPDHLVYPSLQDQSLVDSWLERRFGLGRYLQEPDQDVAAVSREGSGIASFPNKFVFLCSSEAVDQVTAQIEERITGEWMRLAGLVRDELQKKSGDTGLMRALFDRQIADYWTLSWSSAELVRLDQTGDLHLLLDESKWNIEAETVAAFAKGFPNGASAARLYGATHSLAQSLLAAQKSKPARIRHSEQGEKCPLCGEHEVLHSFQYQGTTGAADYRSAVTAFWDKLRDAYNPAGSYAQIGRNERLCAVCAVKRFLPQILKAKKEELLHDVFKDMESFPATTGMAVSPFLAKVTGRRTAPAALIDRLHSQELAGDEADGQFLLEQLKQQAREKNLSFQNRDKYYAVLLMDGDKMGDLVNGKTVSAKWRSVIHPDLAKRFADPAFQKNSPLRNVLDQQRLINPAVHAAVSDALNSFARFGVAPLIAAGHGRLIYAGGDDVCAVMPLDTVLDTARSIAAAYNMHFVNYSADGAVPVADTYDLTAGGKLGFHLGQADKISVSGAIVIAHHKTPLREVMRDAHLVLAQQAKHSAGRNALAVRLSKRSGGDRDAYSKWQQPNLFCPECTVWDSFAVLQQAVENGEIGGSLLYKTAQLKEAVRPLVKCEADLNKYRDRVLQLFQYELNHSGKKVHGKTEPEREERAKELAGHWAGLAVRGSADQEGWFSEEAPVIVNFMAGGDE